MRTAFTIAIALTFFAGSGAGQNANDTIRAWSTTAGPDGVVWHLSIERDSTATVTSSSDLGAKSVERHFKISAAQRQAILWAVEEGQFFTLPKSVGPRSLSSSWTAEYIGARNGWSLAQGVPE
jgi:hypothetical protein